MNGLQRLFYGYYLIHQDMTLHSAFALICFSGDDEPRESARLGVAWRGVAYAEASAICNSKTPMKAFNNHRLMLQDSCESATTRRNRLSFLSQRAQFCSFQPPLDHRLPHAQAFLRECPG
jgi:hypothetical protein